MKFINKHMVQGRLTSDPKIVFTESGAAIANFALATSRPKGKDGAEWVTDFHDVTIIGDAVTKLVEDLKKGDMCLVEGRVEQNKYQDKEGNTRTSRKIVAFDLVTPAAYQRRDQDESQSEDVV